MLPLLTFPRRPTRPTPPREDPGGRRESREGCWLLVDELVEAELVRERSNEGGFRRSVRYGWAPFAIDLRRSYADSEVRVTDSAR